MGRGELIASTLIGITQSVPPAFSMSEEQLTEIAPLLLGSACGALGWWRVRRSPLHSSPPAHELQQAYRLHALHGMIQEQELEQVYTFLRSKGLDPLLAKGWSMARHYPEPGLRPYGDIDLYVRPEQFRAFEDALVGAEARGWHIDLHRGSEELADRSFDELYKRSRVARIGDAEIRVFGTEDHLRLLCLHMLREGVLRPLWLCDLVVGLQSLPSDFDWDYFLSGDKLRTDWVMCAIGMAHKILGAEVEGLPVAHRAKNLPRWMVPVVLQQWGTGRITNGCRRPMAAYLRGRRGLLRALQLRWPNGIEATVRVRGPFNEWPRLPFQIGACLVRGAGFLLRIPKLLSQRPVPEGPVSF